MPFSIRWYTFIVDVSTYAFKPVLVTFPPAFIHECLTNNEVFKNAVIITIPNLFVKCFFRTVPLLTFVKQVLKLLFVKLVFKPVHHCQHRLFWSASKDRKSVV